MFFRLCIEQSIEIYIKSKQSNGPHSYATQGIDSFASLIVFLIKHYNDPSGISQNAQIVQSKIALASKISSIILLILVHSHEEQGLNFNQRPVYRLFSSLLIELHKKEATLQNVYFPIISSLSNTFHSLQPAFLPGFTFSWLQLISHRHFMSKMLNAENQKVYISNSGVAVLSAVDNRLV